MGRSALAVGAAVGTGGVGAVAGIAVGYYVVIVNGGSLLPVPATPAGIAPTVPTISVPLQILLVALVVGVVSAAGAAAAAWVISGS